MKTIIIMLGLTIAGIGWAAPDPGAPAQRSSARELAAVDQFLTLGDQQLDDLISALTRIRAMSAAERMRLREEVQAYRSLPDAERRAMQEGWGSMPEAIRDGWRRLMQTADAGRRAEIQAELGRMSPSERVEFRRKLVEQFLKEKAAKS